MVTWLRRFSRAGRRGRLAGALLVAVPAAAVGAGRTHGGYYTAARLAAAQRNAAGLPWARAQRDAAVARAAYWLRVPDGALWAMVPGQDLPRCISVTLTRGPDGTTNAGCLGCGDRIDRFGSYPYEPDFDGRPWKLTCPACGAVFPTNDFGAYYRSGIDEHGVFNPARADRRLLYNLAHPDPADPLHLYGVDDGYGYVDHDGHAHRFIACYAWKYWRHLIDGLQSLAEAYVDTGDRAYAHKAAVLLDRIADVYPDIDWSPYARRGWYHSDANRGVGKIEGAIWETNVARKLAESYDAIISGTVGDDALFGFLGDQGRRYVLPRPKGTRDDFLRNVDTGILRCIHDAIVAEQISGNEGMQQMAMASCALALDTPPETGAWLDWLFAPDGGAMPGLLLRLVDRDGASDEGAPGYALFAGQLFGRLAARLHGYPGYQAHDLFRDFPQLRANFLLGYRLAALGRAVPNLGDHGMTGLIEPPDAGLAALGFRQTGDPAMAVAAWRMNGDSADGLARDLLEADPDALARRIDALGRAAGPRPVGGNLLTGFGLATLEAGPRDGAAALVLNYGRTIHHAHRDTANFDLLAFGHWLAPDLGYPEFATRWPRREEWTVNTLSHNAVVVDGQPQARGWGGRLGLYAQTPGFGVVAVDGRPAYPQLKTYTRLMALVQAPDGHNSYAIDLFLVRGGTDHLYSFHGPPGEVATVGLTLPAPARGTYAGEAVAYAAAPGGFPPGYSYLYDVRRAAHPPASFVVDWHAAPGYRGVTAADAIHLRYYGLTTLDDVALAHGDPPQNKEGNPRRLSYLLAHRTGKDLHSLFAAVIEPYRAAPFITAVQRLDGAGADGAAVRVAFADGTEDVLLWNPTPGTTLRAAPDLELQGELGFVRRHQGRTQRLVLLNGARLASGADAVASPGAYAGRITDFNHTLDGDGWIAVDTPLPVDGSLRGRQIHIASGGDRDACYTIVSVERDAHGSRLHCGPIAFVRGYDSPLINLRGQEVPARYDSGFVYDFPVGANFVIPVLRDWSPPPTPAGAAATH